ncbi:hypothetical protein HK104_006155 [Borealophlyctis nickersoniae]|nr:hypothetical protein HK104_006155 [Borealophlyctis nickersoniae]
MGKSAKVGRIGKTKKERDALKIAKNSGVIKTIHDPAQTSATSKKSAARDVAKSTPASATVKSSTAKKQQQYDGDIEMGGIAKSTQRQQKKHILEGRVDYVSLMNSRKSGAQMKKITKLAGPPKTK